MLRPKAHRIAEESFTIFKALLPSEIGALSDQLVPDYAKDYVFELVEGNSLTGKQVFIQLKGTERIQTDAKTENVRITLKTHHLKYFERNRVPVFLLLVDVTTHEVYWCFLQQLIREDLRGRKWRSQKSTTIHVPLVNNLRDREAFTSAVDRACDYVAAIQPGIIHAAISEEERRLRSLDPRFDPRVTAKANGYHVEIIPQQEVTGQFLFRLSNELRATDVQECLDAGVPINVPAGAVTATGSPLMAEAVSQACRLELSNCCSVEAVLYANRGDNWPVLRIEGLLKGGVRKRRFRGSLAIDLLTVSFETRIESGKLNIDDFLMHLEISAWFGKRLSTLPHVEEISRLLSAFAQNSFCRLECVRQGRSLFSATGECNLSGIPPVQRELVEAIQIAKSIARETGIDPIVDRSILSEYPTLKAIHDILLHGVHECPGHGRAITCTVLVDGVRSFLSTHRNRKNRAPFQATSANYTSNILGERIELGAIQFTLSETSLQNLEEVERDLAKNETTAIDVVFVGTENSTCKWERLGTKAAG